MPPERVESDGFAIVERGWLCVPCPLVSRDRAVLASGGDVAGLTRRDVGPRSAWRSDGEGAAWVEVHVGLGPTQALVRLEAPTGERLPLRYRLETSGEREGERGWRRELEVVENGSRTRTHVIELDGQSAVRVAFEGPAALDVHDASDGTDDVWLVLGDELAGAAFGEVGPASGFAERVHARYPGYHPALIDESRAGEGAAALLERLGPLLELHASARRVALSFGASPPGPDDIAALGALAQALLAAGRVPMFARAPLLAAAHAGEVAAFNARLAAIEQEHGLEPGPDPSAWAQANGACGDAAAPGGRWQTPPAEARDALAALWVSAADVFYVPQ